MGEWSAEILELGISRFGLYPPLLGSAPCWFPALGAVGYQVSDPSGHLLLPLLALALDAASPGLWTSAESQGGKTPLDVLLPWDSLSLSQCNLAHGVHLQKRINNGDPELCQWADKCRGEAQRDV